MQKLAEIPLSAITVPEGHLRSQSLEERSLERLARSILSAGLLVRILVRPLGRDRYELVDGERRLKAFQGLYESQGRKWIAIPAIVEEMDRKEAIRRQLAMNENRRDLTPYEKARGYKQAWRTGYFENRRELAELIGKSPGTVGRSIDIFDRFPREVIEAFESGKLKQAHLHFFYALPDREAMLKLCRAIIRDGLKSAAARTLANRLDERWLSGDRERLIEVAEKDEKVGPLLGDEIVIADLVNKSKLTLVYPDLTRLRELARHLARLVESTPYQAAINRPVTDY